MAKRKTSEKNTKRSKTSLVAAMNSHARTEQPSKEQVSVTLINKHLKDGKLARKPFESDFLNVNNLALQKVKTVLQQHNISTGLELFMDDMMYTYVVTRNGVIFRVRANSYQKDEVCIVNKNGRRIKKISSAEDIINYTTAVKEIGIFAGNVFTTVLLLIITLVVLLGVAAFGLLKQNQVNIDGGGDTDDSGISPGYHYVEGYTRDDGTQVNGYIRSNPNDTTSDNIRQR